MHIKRITKSLKVALVDFVNSVTTQSLVTTGLFSVKMCSCVLLGTKFWMSWSRYSFLVCMSTVG